VEQHHGKVFAQSRAGVGTTFYLLLPFSPQPSQGESA
jgi:signal transduction histidine kinase